jgi:hypothetical protein
VVEHLLCKCETLSSKPCPTKKQKQKTTEKINVLPFYYYYYYFCRVCGTLRAKNILDFFPQKE